MIDKFIKKTLTYLAMSALLYIVLMITVILINRIQIKECALKENTNTIILGDSHTMWSINDNEIDQVQNISCNAEGYIYTYAKLQHVLKTEPQVKKVYLGLSYHNFSSYFDGYIYGNIFRHFIHRYIGILKMSDYAMLLKKNPKGVLQFSYNIIHKGGEEIFENDCELYGSFPEDKMFETLNLTNLDKRIKEQFYKNGKIINPSSVNIEYLNKIIELCNKHNIHVTVLSTPIHKEYKNRIPEKYIQLFDNFVSENKLSVYDFSDLNLPDSCYLPDADHVNYHGALLSTQKFKEYHEKVSANH